MKWLGYVILGAALVILLRRELREVAGRLNDASDSLRKRRQGKYMGGAEQTALAGVEARQKEELRASPFPLRPEQPGGVIALPDPRKTAYN